MEKISLDNLLDFIEKYTNKDWLIEDGKVTEAGEVVLLVAFPIKGRVAPIREWIPERELRSRLKK